MSPSIAHLVVSAHSGRCLGAARGLGWMSTKLEGGRWADTGSINEAQPVALSGISLVKT